ncbi:prenyltransferase/squalene oxidase repeat-containing protein [Flavobacterium sp. 5]|uniref:prenyltransferase/squalene oxidase repeat-containing protein n=1 Tax=Flavobacterium sp. 5 TaxID=2035199 RepID=UPI000C2B9CF0|nr:prenyltransferase/squalene oxidase repeat-containing protein [Flavobacterium sp. 5]PKB16139.1 geranylgeranyl pyrophosphate synthase [Flavobacterium sp. 5]
MQQKFNNYINDLPIADDFKKIITDTIFKDNNPVYYQKYPELFAEAFVVKQDQLDLLNIAGYLYYQATLFTDGLIDDGDISKFPLITICQEESIKILASIYDLTSDFWILWNSRKKEYLEAIYLEKLLNKKKVVRLYEYEILADKKAAFGKVAIDCLFSLNKEKDESLYQQLLQSHYYFSVAFQLNDDLQDFKKDLQKGQFNWVNYLLQQQELLEVEVDVLEKYLYIRGISKKIYLLGIEYCDKALHLVAHVQVANWKEVLNDTKKRFSTAIKEIDNYLEILIAEINGSKQKIKQNTIKKSLDLAIQSIKIKQQENGSWREYVNQGGISNVWSTAFVLSKITEDSLLKNIFFEEVKKGMVFLENNNKSGLWSYNITWISDADSTTFVFLSCLFDDKEIKTEWLENWLIFQKKNGSFSTYNDNKYLLKALDDINITDVSGWLYTHNCVSAVAFYFLANYDQDNTSFMNLKTYFDSNLLKALTAYWWSSNLYTLYYLAKTYSLLENKFNLNIILKEVKKQQNQNGSFSDSYGENVFYTALGLEVLVLLSQKAASLKAVNYILKNQYNDGSWGNSNALQVPNATDTNPKGDYAIASFGMNVRAKEFNRLFTTVSVLQAFTKYEQKQSSAAF